MFSVDLHTPMSDWPQHGRNRFERGEIDSDIPAVRSLTFDAEEGTYVAEFDDSDGAPSTAVISLAAKITEQSATDLRPLHHVVDTDALDRLVRHRPSGPSRNERFVEFTYADLTIRLSSSSVIEVTLPRGENPDV
jgi:hypothetical protein